MNLGARVKHAREKRELTQEQLVEKVPGLTQPNLSALESRDSKKTKWLFGIAEALSVDPNWLLTGEGVSGLDQPATVSTRDKLLEQLIDLYGQLGEQRRHELVGMANYLHAQEHPHASASNPYGKKRDRAPAKRP